MDAQRRPSRQRALVTGASAGIGRAFAERLARDGYDVVVVARRADRLTRLAQRLREEYSVTVTPLVGDLSQAVELRAVEERIAQDAPLDLLVSNAGVVWARPFMDSDLPESVWMSAEDVVQASLAGLEPGEIVCLPFVKDASVLERLREHQHDLLHDGLIGTLAQRYAAHEP